jgi:hypothetical protein
MVGTEEVDIDVVSFDPEFGDLEVSELVSYR